MIDRYLLRYFLAVIDEGNFSRAAARCNVSQPTLSIGIAKLEGLIGRKLFDRTNRRVALTAAGAELAARARRIESEFLAAERETTATAARPLIRVGLLASIPVQWLRDMARECALCAATEQVEFFEGRERELSEALLRGRIDAALTLIRSGERRFDSEALVEEGYALALSAEHPLAAREEIAAEDLVAETMIVRRHCEALPATSRYFTSRGVRPFFALRTFDDSRALALVQGGLGITVMPDSFNAPGVVRPRLAGFDQRRTIGLCYAAGLDQQRRRESPVLAVMRRLG
ncbi:LysR family transcriptional regulator [Sphingomonas tabacisoli]|uniref:LysR family transcriptional regulator n=1 Tax=Sphingomonas tabacisoli TaxID=2249466 RepID=A0ABW4I1I5_9SPHN